uniref:Mu-type opioid receptor n=1 Tax=Pelusios castaneus TaxID=367368 RepID=A0A8C8SVT8_9SAUR
MCELRIQLWESARECVARAAGEPASQPFGGRAFGTMDGSFAANSSACGPFAPPFGSCSPLPPGAWGNLSGRAEEPGWNQSDPCSGTNSSQGESRGIPCPASGISPSMITAITIMALYSIVCVVGLFGNFLVMYVIIR